MTEIKRNLTHSRLPAWASFSSYSNPVRLSDRSCREALAESGLDYRIDRRAVYTEDSARDPISLPHLRALVRTDEDRPLSIVGENYSVVQNRDIAEMIDRAFPQKPTAAIGSTSARGGVCFVVRTDERRIAGEDHEDYVIVSDERSGKAGLRIAFCPVRVVCQNGLLTGLPGSWSVSLPHHSLTLREEAKLWNVLGALEGKRDRAVEVLEGLAHRVSEDIERVVAAIYPAPKPPALSTVMPLDTRAALEELYERDNVKANRDRGEVLTLTALYDADHPENAGTDWHLYNAVAEYEQFLRPGLDDARRGRSSLFGDGAQTLHRALHLLTK